MTTKNAAVIRERVLASLMEYLTEQGEDVGADSSGSCNFPVVVEGEEGWVQVVVKVPKWCEDDDGYAKREEYTAHTAEKAEKAAAKAAEKKRKEAEREAKKKKA